MHCEFRGVAHRPPACENDNRARRRLGEKQNNSLPTLTGSTDTQNRPRDAVQQRAGATHPTMNWNAAVVMLLTHAHRPYRMANSSSRQRLAKPALRTARGANVHRRESAATCAEAGSAATKPPVPVPDNRNHSSTAGQGHEGKARPRSASWWTNHIEPGMHEYPCQRWWGCTHNGSGREQHVCGQRHRGTAAARD
jgi:hypothetical protein